YPLRVRRNDRAAVTDIGIGQFETRFLIVLLLRHYAIESDHTWTGMCNGGIPYTQSMAAASQIFPHDVEAEESEARGGIYARDCCGWGANGIGKEETIRINQAEA